MKNVIIVVLTAVLLCRTASSQNITIDESFQLQIPGMIKSQAPSSRCLVFLHGDSIYVAGFKRQRTGPFRYVTRLLHNGTADPGFNIMSNAVPVAMAFQEGAQRLFVGSYFESESDIIDQGVVTTDLSGELDNFYKLHLTHSWYHISSIKPEISGSMIIAGRFRIEQDVISYNNMIRLLPSGIIDETFRPQLNEDARITEIEFYGDKFLVAGYNNLFHVNLDGSLDETFLLSRSGPIIKYDVRALAVQPDGKILVGGDLERGLSGPASLERLHPNGTLDHTFSTEINNIVSTILCQLDGRIIAGGYFNEVNGQNQQHLVRLEYNGMIDHSFDIEQGGVRGLTYPVISLVSDANGRLLVGQNVRWSVDDALLRLNCNDCLFDPSYIPPIAFEEPEETEYQAPPIKGPGKDSLVLITHGHRSDGVWVETMAREIENYLEAAGKSNWVVHPHLWVEKADNPRTDPWKSLDNAELQGKWLGLNIPLQEWSHIHLMAHSAGSALIQTLAEWIKRESPGTVLHSTFFDSFGYDESIEYRSYGKDADWSDHYWSKDKETYRQTEKNLLYSYDIDVTYLDIELVENEIYISNGQAEPCYYTVGAHSWPHIFYGESILDPGFGSSLGFPLSKEAGGWQIATNNLRIQNQSPEPLVLGNQTPECYEINIADPIEYSNESIDFDSNMTRSSSEEFVNVFESRVDFNLPAFAAFGQTLKQNNSAWFSAHLATTNLVNRLSARVEVNSGETSGLLALYWNTNIIGEVDLRVTREGSYDCDFRLPTTYTEGVHEIGIRLDRFRNTQVDVSISDIALEYSGPGSPFILANGYTTHDGQHELELIGPAGFVYSVEESTNLVDWTSYATLINTNGTVAFRARECATGTTFYRAILP